MTSSAHPANETALGLFYGWMPAPNGRGTIDILWSCLSTIFLCVWTVIHLPVPYYRGEPSRLSESWKPPLKKKILQSRLVPALISIVAPEAVVLTAYKDWWMAINITRKYSGRPDSSGEFSLVHGFFLNMGGFCLRSPNGNYHQLDYYEINRALRATKKLQRAANHNHNHCTDDTSITSHTNEWIHTLKEVSEGQINCLSKSDSLKKVITCFQAFWFVTQVVSRLHEGQAVKILEVSTSAYVLCVIAAYAFWWKKPQGCTLPLMIETSDLAIVELAQTSYASVEGTWREFVWGGADWFKGGMNLVPLTAFPVLFGAIHVASWNSKLPSEVELWTWRASAMTCVVIPPVLATIVLVSYCLHAVVRGSPWTYPMLPQYIFFSLYSVVRLYMIAEVFASMRALPRSAFDSVTWSTAVPHI
ncbi:hypothetical protein MMC28_010861 [Mycoblastus sanguinarius]|nr:hypothetical protein [Mycoblastus sanguinarius]